MVIRLDQITHMKNAIKFLFGLSALLTLNSCGEEEDSVEYANVVFIFSHQVAEQALILDDISYTNEAGNNFSVETLKYFISDITFHGADGDDVFFDFEHYVDARDGVTLSIGSATEVPFGEYTHVSFTFGLNAEKNTNGRFVNPPENLMEWPMAMGEGYHYMKLEGKFDSLGTTKNYQCHTGPTMGNSNFVVVTLPDSEFTVSASNVSLEIDMDIAKWWETPNTLDLNDMTMIMGNQSMQEQLQANGANVFTGSISTFD